MNNDNDKNNHAQVGEHETEIKNAERYEVNETPTSFLIVRRATNFLPAVIVAIAYTKNDANAICQMFNFR